MKTQTADAPVTLLKLGVPPWLAVVLACICSFMVVFDGAVVNLALPAMQAELQLSAAAQQWVVDSYLLCLGSLMLVSARASDWWGRRRVLMLGIAVFTLASVWAGSAGSALTLLLARALQGCGASALATSTLAIIVTVYPSGQAKARAISAWAASSSLAVAAGVVAGGLLTSELGWRSVMWLNLPIGIVLFLGVALAMQSQTKPNQAAKSLDWPGGLSITLAMASLLWLLTQVLQARQADGNLLLLGLGCGLAWAGFFGLERRHSAPLVPLHLFKIPAVSLGNFVVLGMGAILTASNYFVSLYLQKQLHYSAWQAAITMLPMALSLAVAAMIAREALDRGVRQLPFYGGVCSALGLLGLSWQTQQGQAAQSLMLALIICGTGLGLMLMTATHTAFAAMPKDAAGLAAGLFNSARQLGAALGIALLSLVAGAEQGAGLNYSLVFAVAALWMAGVALVARRLPGLVAH